MSDAPYPRVGCTPLQALPFFAHRLQLGDVQLLWYANLEDVVRAAIIAQQREGTVCGRYEGGKIELWETVFERIFRTPLVKAIKKGRRK